MEYDAFDGFDLLDDIRTACTVGLRKGVKVAGMAASAIETDDLRFQEIFDFVVDLRVGRMRMDKSRRIGRGLAISEDRFVKDGLGQLRASGSRHDRLPGNEKYQTIGCTITNCM